MSYALEAVVVADPVAPTLPIWVGILLAVATVLFGSGGIAAVVKVYSDRKQGVDAHEVVEDDAIAARWEALSRSQVELLIAPLQSRLADVEHKVQTLEAELDISRRKYWTAIPYIRSLLAWFHRHVGEDAPAPPPVPALIAEDV